MHGDGDARRSRRDRTRSHGLLSPGGRPGRHSGTLILADGATVSIADARKVKREGATPDDVLHVPAAGQEALYERLVPGTRVVAQIDWERRYRHMRFHTATHLLCAVVRELVDGCSITHDYARLDFAMTAPLERNVVEDGLRALVEGAHAVSSRWITDDELRAQPALVKSMSVSPPLGFGQVRLLEIKDVDLQACGGTHVANTAEIGAIRVTKIEKKSARTRRVVLGWDAG